MGLNKVLEPNFHRVDAQLPGDHVHHPLKDELVLHAAIAAVGRHRTLVGHDRMAVHQDVAKAIAALDHMRPEDHPNRLGKAHEGAVIVVRLDLQA